MSLQGSAESTIELMGSLSLPEAIVGKSAYEIAVMHGYTGTEAEWVAYLESAQSEKFQETSEKAFADLNELDQKINNDGQKALSDIESAGEEALTEIDNATKAFEGVANEMFPLLAPVINNTASGSSISINDVSPIEHTLGVKVSSDNGIDLSTVNVITKGKNYFNAEYGIENQTDYLGNNLKEGYYSNGAYFQNADGSIYTSFSYGGSGRAYMKVGVIPKGTYVLSGKVKSFEDDFDTRNGLYYGIKDIKNNIEWVNSWYADYYSDTTFPQLFSRTFTNNNDDCELIICLIPANIGATLTMEDICVERIDDVKGETYPANADGTVSGVKSISPDMSLYTDKNGVTLDVAYNADTKLYIDNKFTELQALILNA